MPRADYKICRVCGKHTDEVGPLSHTRQCQRCFGNRFQANLVSMKTMVGPFALHWRQRMAASVGATIPTRLDTTPERR